MEAATRLYGTAFERAGGSAAGPPMNQDAFSCAKRACSVSPPFREVTILASKKCHSVGSRIAAFLWVGVDISASREGGA